MTMKFGRVVAVSLALWLAGFDAGTASAQDQRQAVERRSEERKPEDRSVEASTRIQEELKAVQARVATVIRVVQKVDEQKVDEQKSDQQKARRDCTKQPLKIRQAVEQAPSADGRPSATAGQRRARARRSAGNWRHRRNVPAAPGNSTT
jgi:hypothetical protein